MTCFSTTIIQIHPHQSDSKSLLVFLAMVDPKKARSPSQLLVKTISSPVGIPLAVFLVFVCSEFFSYWECLGARYWQARSRHCFGPLLCYLAEVVSTVRPRERFRPSWPPKIERREGEEWKEGKEDSFMGIVLDSGTLRTNLMSVY